MTEQAKGDGCYSKDSLREFQLEEQLGEALALLSDLRDFHMGEEIADRIDRLLNAEFDPDEDAAADPAAPTGPIRLKVSVTRDASATYSAYITEPDLETAMRKLSRHGYDCPDEVEWNLDDVHTYDQVEACTLEAADTGVILAEYDGEYWVRNA